MTSPLLQNKRRDFGSILSRSGVLLGVIALVLFFSLATPFFLSFDNFVNIGRQSVVLAIAAFAMTLIIISGEIDLSMGAVGTIAGVLCAMAMQSGVSLIIAIGIAIGTGMTFGLANGLISVKLRVPSFIVTLGIASIVSAISRTITENRPVSITNETFLSLFADSTIVGIAINIWYAVVVFALLYFLLRNTTFGTTSYAVGGNINAGKLSGIAAERVKITIFVLAGALIGLAGLLQAARLGTARVDPITNLELDAIAAVVLGGTSFSGGRGSLARTVLGVLLIGVLNNGLSLMNVDSYYQLIVKGLIVIGAVLLDRWSLSLSQKRPS